jgi:hypothetical protein
MYTIDFCMNMLKEIVSQRGEQPFSRKDAALVLGKSESNVSMKMGACGQYGLVVNDRGIGYKLTALYHRIESYISNEDKQTALLTAFKNPSVYSQIIDDNNNKILPATGTMFANLLVQTYKLIRKTADNAAPIFLKNAKSLGVLDPNNKLRFIMPVGTGATKQDDEGGKGEETHTERGSQGGGKGQYTPPPPPPANVFKLPIDLGAKTAYLEYPRDITLDEISILKIMLDAQLSALEKRQKNNPA